MIATLNNDKDKQAAIISTLTQEKNKLLEEKKETKEKLDMLEKKLDQFKEMEDYLKPISVLYKEGGFVKLQSLIRVFPKEDYDQLVELGAKLDIIPLLQSKQVLSITTDLINNFKNDIASCIAKQINSLQETQVQIQKTLDILKESLKNINLPIAEKNKTTSSLETQVHKLEADIKKWKSHKEKFAIESSSETRSSTNTAKETSFEL
eukprot:TRINITY_DN3650_c0_g1_i4.p1 TRINITY_DN3650_c0_g1~~TRINITY_DN3650_c0_g1_i4.p1  ORF type:complete len:207 (+),score=60.13 TRINITY_DN3650_c0_g1_i4:426-1046(+)